MKTSTGNTAHELTLSRIVLLAVGSFALLTELAQASPIEEQPQQREWVYQEYADVVTGQMYPAAFLMSKKAVESSVKTVSLGHGYLSVGNYSKRPTEVQLSWDAFPTKPGVAVCKPGGCELAVRFGAAVANKFIAVQDKHSPTLFLQDGRAFIALATRHVGTIEVEVQTLGDGLVTHRFSTTGRLQVEKLATPKK